MAALVAAMFVALAPTRAQTAVDLGACSSAAGTTNYLVVGDTCSITTEIADGDTYTLSATGTVELSDDGTDRADETPSGLSGKVYTIGTGGTAATELVVRAISPGKVTVTDSAGTPAVYAIEVIESVQFAIVMDDSDQTVKAGTPVKLAISAKGARGEGDGTGTTLTVRLDVPSTGLYFTAGTTDGSTTLPAGTTSQRVWAPSITIDSLDDGAAVPFTTTLLPTLSTAGAPNGEYTITATVTTAAGRLKANQSTTTTLTIGDAGAAIGSATLALDAGQKASVGKGDSVTLVVTSKNSRGENSNPGEVNTVTVFAPFGQLDVVHSYTTANTNYTAEEIAALTGARNSVQVSEKAAATGNVDEVGAVTKVTVSSQDSKERSINVYAIVIGADGSQTTEPLALTFTGAADAIALGDASGTILDRMTDDDDFDMIHFALSATDKAGNDIGNPTVSITVTGPDDKDATSKFTLGQEDLDPDKAGDDQAKITVASKGTATAPLAVGEYTLKVKSRTNAKVAAESTFTVVNVTEVTVALEVNDSAPDGLGDTVTVTATVTAGGSPVPEKTSVTFTASDTSSSNDHVLVSSTGSNTQAAKTKAGVAKASFIAVGTGNAVISVVTAGGGNVTVITSTAGMPAAQEEEPEVVSLDCLSSLTGFSSYTCSVDSSASELFGLLAGRGATAIHLWNGSMWVRYAVVDGSAIPGSSDFTVTEDDILYISN